MNETAIFIKKVLFKCFIIGFVINIFFGILFITGAINNAANIIRYWYGIDQHLFIASAVIMITLLKAGNLILFLIPALALHWMGCKKCCCKEK